MSGGFMMPDIEVRRATLADSRDIIDLDVGLTEPLRVELVNKAIVNGSCLVALVGGQAAGYAILNYSFFHCGFIELLYVGVSMRRRGVGCALLAKCEELCETAKLFVSTNASNLIMRSLLEKRGFLPSGQIENLDEGDPEVIYLKRL